MPKHNGTVTIPVLHLGTLQSDPLTLSVKPASAIQSGSNDSKQPVLLEIEAEPDAPYVQGEVRYTVRLLSRVPLREASLTEPLAGDALVEKLGDDNEYTVQRNGASYQVVERRYAIFPQHSGALTIESPLLAASIPVSGRRGGMFDNSPFAGFPGFGSMFTETKPLRLRGRAINLDVQPQPADVQGNWLPAHALTLTENWSPEPPVFRVGEPVTRTVSIIAEGLSAAQLPAIATDVPDNFKAYPDQPQTSTETQGNYLIGTRTQKIALVPTTAGEMVLPEITVSWWDTDARQERVATLPARHINVLVAKPGATTTAQAPGSSVPLQKAQAEETRVAATSDTPAVNAESDQSGSSLAYWPWIAGVLFLAWLATLLLWLRDRGKPSREALQAAQADTPTTTKHRLAESRTGLQKACMASDVKAAAKALRDWAAARWPESPPKGLPELAQRLGSEAARREVIALDRLLYSDGNKALAWDGKTAWSVLKDGLSHAGRGDLAQTTESLPELYPRFS